MNNFFYKFNGSCHLVKTTSLADALVKKQAFKETFKTIKDCLGPDYNKSQKIYTFERRKRLLTDIYENQRSKKIKTTDIKTNIKRKERQDLFVEGPHIVLVLKHRVLDIEVILFGEYHAKETSCPTINYVKIYDFIKLYATLVKNKLLFFVEKSLYSLENQRMRTSYMTELTDETKNCFNQKKANNKQTDCPSNIEFHFGDPRYHKDIIGDITRINHINSKLTYENTISSQNLLYIESIASDKSKFIDNLKNVLAKIKKQIDSINSKEIKDLLTTLYNKYLLRFPQILNNLKLQIKDIIKSNTTNMKDNSILIDYDDDFDFYEDIHLLDNQLDSLLDFYSVARSLKYFGVDGEGGGGGNGGNNALKSSNIIMLTGAAHTIGIADILYKLNFELKYKNGHFHHNIEVGEHRVQCINVRPIILSHFKTIDDYNNFILNYKRANICFTDLKDIDKTSFNILSKKACFLYTLVSNMKQFPKYFKQSSDFYIFIRATIEFRDHAYIYKNGSWFVYVNNLLSTNYVPLAFMIDDLKKQIEYETIWLNIKYKEVLKDEISKNDLDLALKDSDPNSILNYLDSDYVRGNLIFSINFSYNRQ